MKDCKILIVEDEQIIAENLRFVLNEYGYQFVDVAIDSDEAQELFQQEHYDLVLMDINLGEYSDIDGIDLIKILSKTYSFSYLYVTANADERTVEKAKGTEPCGYIVKPFVNASIYANVEMALNNFKEKQTFVYNHNGIQKQMMLSEILYLKADGAYTTIFTVDSKTQFVRKMLSEFIDMYPEILIRIHKSIVVNKTYIQGYTSLIVSIDGQKLPLGRSYKTAFVNRVKSLSFS